MKNHIIYYYNLIPDNIKQNSNDYVFKCDGMLYVFRRIYRSVEEIYELYLLSENLISQGYKINQIVKSNNGELYTLYNNFNYVLMRTNFDNDRRIEYNDLIAFKSMTSNMKFNFIDRSDWIKLWSEKIDYFELQLEENRNKFSLFSSDIDYFIGLSENAIQILRKVGFGTKCVSHIRINRNMRLSELYDPTTFVIDYNVRDIVEYIKDLIFFSNDKVDIDEFLNCVEDLNLFFCRFLFITSYFDLFDTCLSGDEFADFKLNKIRNNISYYEETIKKIYKNCHFNFYIDWI